MKRGSLWLGLLIACSVAPKNPVQDAASPRPSRADLGAVDMRAEDAGESLDAGSEDAGVALAEGWWRAAVGYQIFVRSYQDSDGDGIGDLDGIRQRLEHLSDLGIDLLWLTPVQPSPSYHGYDVTDYRGIEAVYGADAAYQRLLDAAHARGIRVVMDLVLNHTSTAHPWFVQASQGGDKRDWFVWRAEDPGWTQPWSAGRVWHGGGKSWYYGLFWRGMPDLNYENPQVRSQMIDVAKHWERLGVDGFRLDAARFLVETSQGAGQQDQRGTHEFLSALRAALEPRTLLVGEVWADNAIVQTYFGAQDAPELDMAFDFQLAASALSSIQTEDAQALVQALEQGSLRFPAWGRAGRFLSNHDQVRVASVLPERGAQKLAATLLLTIGGTPWIYYGEEIGQSDGDQSIGDRAHRRPMQWSASNGFSQSTPWLQPQSQRFEDTVQGQAQDPDSLLNHYRAMIALRKAHPILAEGDLTILRGLPKPALGLRRGGQAVVLAVYNLAQRVLQVQIPAAELGTEAQTFEALRTGARFTRKAGAPLSLGVMAPQSALFLQAR